MAVFVVVVLVSLVGIAYQDFKYRLVSWWWFVLLFLGVAGVLQLSYQPIFLQGILVNTGICLFVASLIGLIYLVKYGFKGFNKIVNSIGVGDIIMIPALLCLFSPLNFVLFVIVSTFIGLVGHFLVVCLSGRVQTIPLAGYWAILLIVSFLFSLTEIYNIRDDNFLFIWLTNY